MKIVFEMKLTKTVLGSLIEMKIWNDKAPKELRQIKLDDLISFMEKLNVEKMIIKETDEKNKFRITLLSGNKDFKILWFIDAETLFECIENFLRGLSNV